MLIGQDHTPTNVVPGVQCAVHRISIDVNLGLTDNQLRHKIWNTNMPRDLFRIYPHGGVTLKQFLDECKRLNVIPMVNLNFGRRIWNIDKRPNDWKRKYTTAQWSRLSRLVGEIMLGQYNFDEQYVLVFNEPAKWLDRHEIGMYTRATNQGFGSIRARLPIVAINEERDLAVHHGDVYRYVLTHFRKDFDYIGDHPLSSIMNDAYWKIGAQASLAREFNMPIMATEAGSWEHRYTSPTGHERNKRIILECKKHGYKCCNIVLIDCNTSYPNLGYRRWDKYYNNIIDVPRMTPAVTYFDDFMDFAKQHGRQEQQEEQKGVIDGMIIRTIGVGANDIKRGYPVGFLQELLSVHDELPDSYITEEWNSATDNALRNFQEKMQEKYPNVRVDGRAGRQTFRMLITEIEDEKMRNDYEFALHVIMSPFNARGDT